MTVAKSKIDRPYAPDYVDATTLAYRLCISEIDRGEAGSHQPIAKGT